MLMLTLMCCRCANGMTIEGTAMQDAWKDGGESRKMAMNMIKERKEEREKKLREKKMLKMERDMERAMRETEGDF